MIKAISIAITSGMCGRIVLRYTATVNGCTQVSARIVIFGHTVKAMACISGMIMENCCYAISFG
jgi:hypothetical protein